MSDAGYYRHPALCGDRIVFVCEDDLWGVPVTGGVPRRLTANPGTASFPVASPDGKWIAFTGRDDGPQEAYVMPAEGGPPRRLTWFGGMTTTVAWTPDSKEVVVASDTGQPFRGYVHLHAVPLDNPAAARPLKVGPSRAISWEPDGKGVVIGRNSGDPARWKRYRGGTAGTLWIDRAGKGEFEPLVRLPGNLANPMWLRGRVFFLSDHEAHGNLYSVLPDGSDLRRHTHHEDFYVRFPSSDGKRIAYHAGADLFTFDPSSGESRRVDVRWTSSRAQRNRRYAPAAKHLESFDLHPEGHSISCVVRGAVYAMGLWEGAPARLGKPCGVRQRLARFLPDGKRVVAVTDEGGEEGLAVLPVDGGESRLVPGDFGRAIDLVVAPAGADRVALTNQRQEVIVVDLGTGTSTVVEKSPFDRIDGLAWSPDGRWLAYAFPGTRRTVALHLWDSTTKKVTAATRDEFRDVQPSFDPEGKYLHFLSWRVFDPVYDSQYFDLGFPRGCRPHLIPLKKDAPSPFSPTTRAPRPPLPPTPGNGHGKNGGDGAPKPPPGVEIDLDGILDRVVAYPVPEGRYVTIRAVPGRALFSSTPVEGSLALDWRNTGAPEAKTTLEAWDFETDKSVVVANGISAFETSRDGKVLGLRVGNRIRAVPATIQAKDLQPKDDPGRESGWLDLDRLRVEIVPGDEWRQMFREAWRLQRDQFWTPDMSSIEWQSVNDRYGSLVQRCATRAEFSDLLWEMQGELNTSHAYEMFGDYRPEPTWFQGSLGADLAFDSAAGTWRVARIPRGDSWDVTKASPLAAPAVNVGAGAAILSVDGEPVGRDVHPAAKLVDRAGRDVRLVVRDGAGVRTVAVRTLKEDYSLRYRDWVEANRARVHEATGGKAGYVHIPNMGPLGYSEFHRYYLAEVDREGLLVDVRWNGGGHVSQLLLEKLARRRIGWDQSRWMAPSPWPSDSPAGPMVALTNEYAGSDGDIFSHCFRQYGLGPLIGKRTWGGVVGIWPRHALVDGTLTTQPEFANWFEGAEWGVEGHGVDPDLEVEIRPQDHAAGKDPQLTRGIEVLLERIAKVKPVVPDLSRNRPVRKPPPLPKAP